MGLFDKLFGHKVDYPPLDESNPVMPTLDEHRARLEEIARDVPGPLEVVPAEGTMYVFIGKPPKQFGLAWIDEGRVRNFKDLMDEGKLNSLTAKPVIEALRESYENSQEAERFVTTIAEQEVVVTPSPDLGKRIDEIIRKVA